LTQNNGVRSMPLLNFQAFRLVPKPFFATIIRETETATQYHNFEK
jgi:hypothetical protein